jgi:major vault protein
VRVKTRDHVELDVALSYRVSFVSRGAESDASRWFNVNDYVALLCDHLASLVRAAVRAHPIDSFHATGAEIVRSAVLGEKHEGEPRAGRLFEENGRWTSRSSSGASPSPAPTARWRSTDESGSGAPRARPPRWT